VATDARSGDSSQLPPPNVPLTATLFVTSDGKVVVETWTLTGAPAARMALVTGNKKIAAYRVAYNTNNCGGGGACEPVCSSSDIKSLLLTGSQSVSRFYSIVSLRQFVIDTVDVFEASVDQTKVATFGTLAAIGKQPGYDYHIMFFPPNTGWDKFATDAAGYGKQRFCCVFGLVLKLKSRWCR
jgi:hypothetical protein